MAIKKGARKKPVETIKTLRAEVNRKLEELTDSNRRLKRKIFDLYTIFELSRNFNAVLNYETLLDSFVLTSMGQMGAQKAALYLPREVGRKEFRLARVKGAPPFPREEISIDPEGEFGKYITALNRPVLINEISGAFSAPEIQAFQKYFPEGLVVPLIFQTKLRGILIISVKASGLSYKDDDIEFLSILANQTAVSIENARLYDSEREAIEKLQKTQELLVQSERLAALGELSAKIAHEVNNPLGIIKNYLALTGRNIDDSVKASEYLEVVGQEIDRIAMIVRQLLDFHSPRVIKFAPTDLVRLLNETAALMSRQLADAGVEILIDAAEDFPTIVAWPDGLKQVFINLFINAKEAMKEGGKVLVSATHNRHLVCLRFCDSGTGIDPKHVPHIFEPFYTTKESGGTGLGLSVCYGIIKNHNGSIEFYNLEKGGCFEIRLPIQQEELDNDWKI